MQPRKPLSKEEALSLACDALREVGLELEATRLEQREHVTYLLSHPPLDHDDDLICVCCSQFQDRPHKDDCQVLAAWKALGDPRVAENEQAKVDEAAAKKAHEEQIARVKEEERLAREDPCQEKNAVFTQCNLRRGHEGKCRFPPTMTQMNNWLKEAFRDPKLPRLETEGGLPDKKDPAAGIVGGAVGGPLIRPADLSETTLFGKEHANVSPVEAMRRAAEALGIRGKK